ncbi:hypothetical protein [Risungbinella massiliensis]|uniref:hypothetical protein n=1 Tax=Risungbinella massiliensis TaxID=1329796 RepID=UPI0005CC3B94|nr:hypothetical protein [Risungbinella massiliensis]
MIYLSISEQERQLFECVIQEVGNDPLKAGATIKVLFNLLRKTSLVPLALQQEVEQVLTQRSPYDGIQDSLREELYKLGALVAEIAQEDQGKTYTTGQLAKVFGVSITTINNWIGSGRFIGVERTTRNKQARISENTLWISPNDERIPVFDVVALYEKNSEMLSYSKASSDDKLDRIRYLVDVVDHFEKKYGSSYKEVESQKGDPSRSEDWIWAREGKEWQMTLRELGDI